MNKTSWRYRAWKNLGHVLYFLTWPGIWLVVKLTPPRTRVLLIVDDKILLTKDWLGSGRWNVPGGGLHRNEDEHNGAVRELFEETGIMLSPSQLTYLNTTKAGNKMSTNLLFFQASLSKMPKVSLQKFEILEYRWIDLHKIETINLDSVSRQVVVSLITG